MKLTYDEILEKVKAVCNYSVEAFAYDDFGKSYSDDSERNFDHSYIFVEGVGACKEVHQKGGSGMGDEWYSVKYFPEHDVYIRVDGFYSSYHGVNFDEEWDCCSQVRPKEKTITVYE
jgi:hypothetical protein